LGLKKKIKKNSIVNYNWNIVRNYCQIKQ